MKCRAPSQLAVKILLLSWLCGCGEDCNSSTAAEYDLVQAEAPAPVVPGQTIDFLVGLNRLSSFSSPVALGILDPPAGFSYDDLAGFQPGETVTHLKINTTAAAPAGQTCFHVVGTADGAKQRNVLTSFLCASVLTPGTYAIKAATLSVPPNSTRTETVSIIRQSFDAPVALSAVVTGPGPTDGQPAGTDYPASLPGFSVALAPDVVTNTDAVLTVQGPSTLDPAIVTLASLRGLAYTVTITGHTPGGPPDVVKQVLVAIDASTTAVAVSALPPALNIAAGGQDTTTVSVSGNTRGEAATIVVHPPDGILVSPTESSTHDQLLLTVSVATATAPGDYLVPIDANFLSLGSHSSTTLTVHVIPASGGPGGAGMGGAGGAGGGPATPSGCYPDCIESLPSQCVPAPPCTSSQTPPPTYPPDFFFCYDNGVRIASMSTATGSLHTQYKADGTTVCFTIETTFSGSCGRNVTETWKNAAGTVVGTETYDTMDGSGGLAHVVSCNGQSYAVDTTAAGCSTPSNCTTVDVPTAPGGAGCIAPKN